MSLKIFTAGDDQFHSPTDDPWFTETCWFSFHVPERKMSGWLYGFLRPNLGICTSSVFIYDDSCTGAPWTARYYHMQQAHPEPAVRDLTDYTFPVGYRVRVTKPAMDYHLTFAKPGVIEMDLTFCAIHPAVPFQKGAFIHSMHYDQIGRVRGTILLGEERIAVDCCSIRDRSWGPRTDVRPPTFDRIAYDYAGNLRDTGFCIFADQHEFGEGGSSGLTYGFWLNDGKLANLVSGTRRCERDPKELWVTQVVIDAVDEFGQQHQAIGRSHSHFLWPPSRWLTSTSFIEWTVDGQQAWGEDQDLWQYEQWIGAWRARNLG